jgi:hypothetical protein
VNEVPRPPPGSTATVSFNTASAATAALTPEEQRAAGAGTVGALAMPSKVPTNDDRTSGPHKECVP